MGLFSKKKEETKSCCCGGNCTPETMAQAETAKAAAGVKVLGTGCAKCNAPGRCCSCRPHGAGDGYDH